MSHEKALAGRVALVTGAGAGIGRAIALELAAMGASVVVNGRRAAALDETIALVRGAGGDGRALAGDLREKPVLERICALERVDAFVHAAVHFPTYGELHAIDDAELTRTFDVAVHAPMRITARLLAGMESRRFGRVVMIGSVAATNGARLQAAYSSAKSALHGFVKSVALEAAPRGVTCNLVEPGLVLTERVRAAIPAETQRALIAATPMGRPGTPEEIAAVVGFLCSPRASYVTGAIVAATGGLGLGLFPAPPR